MKLPLSIATVLCAVALAAPAQATAAPTTVSATFDVAQDSFKPFNDTRPRGSASFSQVGANGAITGRVRVTGLLPGRAYIVVNYTDGACLPTPGVTAFPSSSFTTDATGSATATLTTNPAALNPAGMLDLRNVRSVSIREVLVPPVTSGPVTVPNLPTPLTEACDAAPVVA